MFGEREQGSASVELALSLPLLTVFLGLMVQVGVVLLDQLAVTQAAREAARAAAVDPSRAAAAVAAQRSQRLKAERMNVVVGPRPDSGGMVTVRVGYRTRFVLPFTEQSLFEPKLEAAATMRVEGSGG